MKKISTILQLPIVDIYVSENKKHVNTDTRRHKGCALFDDGKAAVIVAVNNHDKLVELLTRVSKAIKTCKSEIELADEITESCHDIQMALDEINK